MNYLLIAQTAPAIASEEQGFVFSNLAPPLQVAIVLGALSFASAALVSLTAFTRIIIVLSFVRRALSTQEIPPNPVMLGLSLFLTLFVMAPTFDAIHKKALLPLLKSSSSQATLEAVASQQLSPIASQDIGLSAALSSNSDSVTPEDLVSRMSEGLNADAEKAFGFEDAWVIASHELKKFMMKNTRTSDLKLFFDLSNTEVPYERLDTPLKILVPAFIISELKTAFIMGFCIYIPFLLIDLVVSTFLMALGMMMMPPVVVSTPCKLLLFVMVDGWQLIAKALVSSFAGT